MSRPSYRVADVSLRVRSGNAVGASMRRIKRNKTKQTTGNGDKGRQKRVVSYLRSLGLWVSSLVSAVIGALPGGVLNSFGDKIAQRARSWSSPLGAAKTERFLETAVMTEGWGFAPGGNIRAKKKVNEESLLHPISRLVLVRGGICSNSESF